ncbi:CDKL1 [Bugula neritina]|uniref:CDKL1 n=1 Tax=Bugula neritina TaxID=10212 RepID=A0A7J7J7X2_BUGNE|nr:CDKL1 [Bugula neritina]
MQVFSTNSFFKGMSIPKPERRESLQEKIPNASDKAIEFLECCFYMDPANRSTCDELLQHKYFEREVYSETKRPSNRYHLNSRNNLPTLYTQQSKSPLFHQPKYYKQERNKGGSTHLPYLQSER